MSVKQFSPTPGVKSGKPALPNNFTVTPATQGTKGTGSAPELEHGSVGGNAAQKNSATKNYAGQKTLVSTDIPSRVVGEQDKWPERVQEFEPTF